MKLEIIALHVTDVISVLCISVYKRIVAVKKKHKPEHYVTFITWTNLQIFYTHVALKSGVE